MVILYIPQSPLPTQVKMSLFSSQSKQKQEYLDCKTQSESSARLVTDPAAIPMPCSFILCDSRELDCLGPHLANCLLLKLEIRFGSSTLEKSFHIYCGLTEKPCKAQTKASVTPSHAGFA